MNGRKAKQTRRLAAQLREAGLDPPRRARQLRPWLKAHYALTIPRPAPGRRPRPGPAQVREYQPLGSRKVGHPGPPGPARLRRHEQLEATRGRRQARRARWRTRVARRRERRQQQAA